MGAFSLFLFPSQLRRAVDEEVALSKQVFLLTVCEQDLEEE